MNNIILNWPQIKIIKELSISQMLKEYVEYLQRVDKNIHQSFEIPGLSELVSDWEKGMEKLRQQRVLILLGVGMVPKNVQGHIDYLEEHGVIATTLEWPEFIGEMASFKVQSDWLVRQIDKPVVIVGHSLGHLIGLQFAHDYPDKVIAFLGSCGPARSHDDMFPGKLVNLLQKMEPISGEEIFKILVKFNIKQAELPAHTHGGIGTMARIYLTHLLPPTPDYWEKLYRELPEGLPTHYRYGLKDSTVLQGVGMNAVFQANNAEIVFDPNVGHSMYSPENTLKVLGHLLVNAKITIHGQN